MNRSRRRFLKIAGASVLGIGAAPVVRTLAAKEPAEFEPNPEALHAKRWAMVVDQRRGCPDGCKACIEACHTTHNVPKVPNKKEEIKWIWTEGYEHAFPGQGDRFSEIWVEEGLKGQPIILLCNHCDNPPCVRVCPTKATFQREDGIVMMDYHRCIGCRFCLAGCPFGARSMNWSDPRQYFKDGKFPNPDYPTRTRGVVEKCNFCAERLAVGQIPACVEACRQAAKKTDTEPVLYFGDVEDESSEVREIISKHYTVRRKSYLGTMPQVYYML
jgi:Fe-S-cluster-containing dehydrogenase component